MIKSAFKFGLGTIILTGAGLGGALLVAGPQRTHAVINQVHTGLLEQIDENIDDPSALRSQLRSMEAEYPERIGQVRGDLAELRQQVRQLERDQAICERVVHMAEGDLNTLEPVMNEASAQRASTGSSSVRVVSWDDKVYSYDRAANQLNQVRQTIVAYANRAADAEHDLTYLRQQEGRLDELLLTLESERVEFQSQIMQLNRQVDAIARNERLIDLLADRNKTIEKFSKFDAVSLDGMTSRLSEVRARQQAELDMLASSQQKMDYEEMARMSLNGRDAGYESMTPLPLLPEVTAGE
ncbi:MAG: chromosome segregation ATPase [Candidatus Paceibacteria bacterium]|jgi:chromosome segregation ATPase